MQTDEGKRTENNYDKCKTSDKKGVDCVHNVQHSIQNNNTTAGGGRRDLAHACSDDPLSIIWKRVTCTTPPRRYNNDKHTTDANDETTTLTKATPITQQEEKGSSKVGEKDKEDHMQQGGKSGSYEMTSSKSRNDDRWQHNKKIKAETDTGTSVNFVVIEKNARLLHSSDIFEEPLKEKEEFEWDAILLCEK